MKSIFWVTLFVIQSSAQESTTIEPTASSAAPLICNPASFKLIMPENIYHDKVRKISVQNRKVDECSRHPQYVWSVYQLNTDQNPGQVTHVKIDNVLDYEGPSEKTDNNLMLSRADVSVQIYLYELQMSVQLIPAAGWNPWFQNKTFLAKAYDMTIMLKGSYNRVHLYKSEDLVLDASISTDRSYKDNGIDSMKQNDIQWKCQPPSVQPPQPQPLTWTVPDEVLHEILSEEVPVISCSVTITRKGTPFFPQKRSNRQSITLKKPPSPKIKLTCVSNCNQPDAYKDTVFSYQCVSECLKQEPTWTYHPYNQTQAEHYVTADDNGHITFRATAFRPGDSVKIVASLADATASLSLVFRVPKPVLTLTCIENCEYEPRAETILQLECTNDCDNLDLDWKISHEDKDVRDWVKDMVMTIGAGVFKDGDNLIVSVTSHGGIATLDATFREEVPELVLSCQLFDTTDCSTSAPDPREIVHLTVTCLKHCKYVEYVWVLDPEPLGYDIVSNLNPPDRDVLTIHGNTFTDGQDIKVTVSSGKTSETFSTKYTEKIPELVIECLSNCNKEVGNTMEETMLKPVCTARCSYLDYVWTVNTYSPARVKTWVADRSILTIPAGTLIDGENTFTLTSGKGMKTLTKLYVKPVPQLTITCEANCVDPNPTKETVLKVNCQPANQCNIEYKWLITPLPVNFTWAEKTSLTEQHTILTIKPNTFQDSNTVQFQVTDSDKAEATLTLTYTEPMPVISITCEKNCDQPHPLYLTELRVICEDNCEGDYEWDFQPKPANVIKDIATVGHVVTIAGEVYNDGTSVTATVKSGRATATYVISYKLQPPVLLLVCHPPCDEPHDPKDALVVNVTCTTHCPKVLKYTWKLEPTEYDAKKVIYQKNLDSLMIMPDTFTDGKSVTVTVSTQPENETPKVLTFSEVPPDIVLQCVTNCWEATPLQDVVLSATCIDFCKNIDSYQWILDPAPTNWTAITFSPKNATITIKPEVYKDLDTVNVTLLARNANKTKTLTFNELPAVLTLTCTQNCNPSNPFEDVVLEVTCTKYCHELQYDWSKVEPEPDGWNVKTKIHLSKKNSSMVIFKNFFHDGDVHRFFVTSRKGSAHCDVRFVVPPAELKLICVSNCHPTANPLADITILTMCVRFCYGDYQWSLSPLASGVVLTEPKGVNNTLVIPAEKYLDQGSVRVKIFTNNSEQIMDLYFSEPTPQLSLTCVSCKTNTLSPLSDAIFNVTCLQNCDHLNYTWDFSPTTSAITYGPQNTTATIPKRTFSDKQQLLITVHSRKGHANTTVLYRTPPGYILITCTNQNCPYANPLKPVVFTLTCFFDCEHQDWIWDIEPHDPNFNWTKSIQTDGDNKTLTILPEAFADGQVLQLDAWADGSDYLRNKTIIKFEEPTPNVTITCVKNCRPSSSVRDVELKATCWFNCEALLYKWTLEPKSHHVILANNKEANFIIKAGSYYFNETITVHLEARKAKPNLTITFGPAGWDGQCFHEPNSGISGVTLFAIGCDYFQDGVMYRAYQDYPGNALGVMLTYGQSRFLDFVYLNAGKSSVTVLVGNGFETKKKIRLKVGTVRPVPGSGSRALFKKIVGVDREDFSGMVKRRRNVQRTVQFASLLWTALEGVQAEDAAHYNRHIIAEINTLADIIEPTQLLSLYTKFLKNPPTDMFTIRLLTEGIRKTVNHAISTINSSIYQNNETLPLFCTETLSLLSTLLTQPKPQPNPDYPTKTDYQPPIADFKRHLRKFTHDLLATTEVLVQLFTSEEIISKGITLRVGKLLADAKNPERLTITGSESYIETGPKFGAGLKAHGVDFKYALGFFAEDPFWWQKLGINTDVVQFSANVLPSPVFVHLSVTPQTGEFSGTVSGEIVYEFSVKGRGMFSASFVVKNVPYVVNTYPRVSKTIVKGTETVDYAVEDEKFIYVVVSGNRGEKTEYAGRYKMLECFSWPTGDLAPTNAGCRAFNKFPNFVSCECSHLSHFAGKLSVPEISKQSNITMRFTQTAPNFIIPGTVAVFCLVFLLLAGFAFLKDGKEKTEVVSLPDNQPGDNELYLINIATGITTATTSDIAIEVTGTEAKTRIHLIQNLTTRNDEHFFAMYTEKHLGDLTTLRIWTNSKGSTPDWYCERIIIEHFPTRKKYLFLIEKSFSLFNSCSGTFHITNPTLTFSQRLREAIRDNHHLLTLFTQRPRAVNKETVVIGYATCSFAMLIALVLTIYAPDFALLSTASIAAVVTIPVSFLLNHLFRNSP